MQLSPIAHIHSPHTAKFAIPRQSNIVPGLTSVVTFLPPYRDPQALRGIEQFDYLWLIWLFSANPDGQWSPTVRPPRLGGNARIGVFASRSPFRPNPVGLSSVRLLSVNLDTPDGPQLVVSGADLLDGTPILDIKPYIPYTDAHPDANAGYASQPPQPSLTVDCPEHLRAKIPASQRQSLLQLLALDPRPAYHNDPERLYGFNFLNLEIQFKVQENNALCVINIF